MRILVSVVIGLLAGCLEDGRPLDEYLGREASVEPPERDAMVLDDDPPETCSPMTQARAEITFINNFADRTLAVFWVDFNCVERRVDTVRPKQVQLHQSFEGHIFRVRDAERLDLLLEYSGPTPDEVNRVELP